MIPIFFGSALITWYFHGLLKFNNISKFESQACILAFLMDIPKVIKLNIMKKSIHC
jgi:hypothetical protein